jgi:hypothetical protein
VDADVPERDCLRLFVCTGVHKVDGGADRVIGRLAVAGLTARMADSLACSEEGHTSVDVHSLMNPSSSVN